METLNAVELEEISGGRFWVGLDRLVTLIDLTKYGYQSISYMNGRELNHNSDFMSAATNRL